MLKKSTKWALPLVASAMMLSCGPKALKLAEDNLCAAPWIVTSYHIEIQGPGIDTAYEAFPLLHPCVQDDIDIYENNGNWQRSEGATTCDPDNPNTASGTWSFQNEQKELIVNGRLFEVVQLDEERLILKTHTSDDYETTETFTYQH